MLSLRNRFGLAGVISVLALVFALVGGAYAADGSGDSASTSAKKKNRKGGKNAGLNGKQKRQVIVLVKRFGGQGPIGPQGVPGLPGAPGSDGDDGSDGSDGDDGSDGSNGQSVAVANENPGANCLNGGKKLTSASGTDYVCNGENGTNGNNGLPGDPWSPDNELPEGATETGSWSLAILAEGLVADAISFPVQLSEPLDSAHVHVSTEAGFESTCTGDAGNPTAPSGHLCIYQGNAILPAAEIATTNPSDGVEGTASVAGLVLSAMGPVGDWGTWAVTG